MTLNESLRLQKLLKARRRMAVTVAQHQQKQQHAGGCRIPGCWACAGGGAGLLAAIARAATDSDDTPPPSTTLN